MNSVEFLHSKHLPMEGLETVQAQVYCTLLVSSCNFASSVFSAALFAASFSHLDRPVTKTAPIDVAVASFPRGAEVTDQLFRQSATKIHLFWNENATIF